MKKGLCAIAIALLCLMAALPAFAEAAEEARTEPVSIMDYVLSSDPESAGDPLRVRPVTPDTAYQKFYRYTDNIVLRGIYEKSGYFFKVANYWDTRYALAQIEYTVSPLIENVPATLTFFINDYPIYSCRVDFQNGASQIVFVLIPVEYLKEGYNEFSLTGYVRLYDDDGCLDDFSGANWVSVSKTSFIEVGYDLLDTHNRISYYPYPMISTMDEMGQDVAVYVPPQATEEELRTAFLLRADLGNETSDEDHVGFKTLDHWEEEPKNALIVARRSSLPQEVLSHIPADAKYTAEGALVFEYARGNGTVLVITAERDGDLIEGACMLMDEDRVTQEKSDWAFVPSGSADEVVMNRALSDLILNGETIKGITQMEGVNFIGPFHQEAVLYLPFSGGYMLGEGGKIDLLMRYSDNLDFDRSMVTVYWGDTPVASRKLDREKANEDTFSFMMPSDVVGTHASTIKIAFDLEIKELYCTKRADEMPWAYVSGNSVLYLPSGSSSVYDLSLRPYPFQQLGMFNHLAVVVPDHMSEMDYTLFGRMASLLGANVSPYGEISVFFASDYPAESQNCHVLALGTYLSNAFIRKLNDSLSFQYAPEGDRFVSNEQLLLSERYARDIAILQIIRSPYQKGRAILVVSASNEEALEYVEQFAAVQENTWKLTGDAFVIDRDLDSKSYRFLYETETEQPSLLERIAEHRDAVLFTLVSTGAMLVMLIAVVLILIRYRRNRQEELKK